jgi:hypothetical protein
LFNCINNLSIHQNQIVMRKLFTLLVLLFLWTTGMTQERVTSNAVSFGSFAPQSVQQKHPLAPANAGITQGTNMSLPQGRRGEFSLTQVGNSGPGIMAISGGITCTTIGYIAGSTQTLNFTLSFTSPDLEYIDGVSMTFPAGMVPQTAGTSNPLAPANGGSSANMNLNPITGQTVVWGQITTPSGWGALIPGTYNFSVSVAIAPGLTGTQDISYYIMGDGYGGVPHTISGTTSIIPAVGVDVGVASISMGTYYNTGALITPKAVVQNFGSTAQTFTVSMTINNGTTNIYTDTKTVTSLAATALQTVTFNNWTTVTGNHTVTVTTTLAGDANAANNTQIKQVAVGSMPYPAMTGNTSDLVYQSIDLSTGVLTNIGTIGSAPFPMAEEYNGVAVYRVYNDFGFGIVGPDGTYSQLGTLTGVAGTPTGLAWNWATSTMYVVVLNASSLPQLCTINMNTFALTLIGTGTAGVIIGIDFANDGYIYGPSLNPDNLYRIDPATGATTSIGPLGIDINFGQDVSFDLATNQLFTCTVGAIYQFGTYNLTTGAFTAIASTNNKQHATFVITNGVPACFAPTALTVNNRTTVSALLGWTPGGSEAGWLVEVGLPGFTPGNDEHVFKDSPVTNSVTATGLSAGTRYQFFVQADCGSDVSAWSGGFFATNIECPGGALVEIEVCGDSTNNACNNVLPGNQTSEPISLGQTVCGTSYFNGTLRDSDWYSFTLTEARQVSLSGKADFDLQLLFVTPCPASVIASGTALAGVTATVSTQLGPGTYYVWVGPQFTGVFACGDDNQYYATLTGTAITEYCTPAPTSVDGLGITNVTFSTVNNTTGAETGNYGDYSSLIGNVTRTLTIPVSITYQTGYTYATKIWIDWNDDYFFDASEEVYSGESLFDNPTTLEASFAVAADAPLGNHRMRIGGVDIGTPTPCYTGSWGSFEDYTVNVIDLPASPVLSVTPASKNYGSVAVGSSSSQVFTISNVGGGTLSINPAVSITGTDVGQFILTDLNSYPVNLTSGQSIAVTVAFTPTTSGAKSANLNVVSNAGTTVVPLSGNGILRPAGSTCDNPYPVTLPVVNYTDNTEAYGNDYLGSWVTPTTSYLNGYDFVAQFTLTEAGYLSGSVSGSWTGVIIVQDCPNATTPASLLALGSGSNGGSFSNVLLSPGSYFAIVSTWPTPNFTSFVLNLSLITSPTIGCGNTNLGLLTPTTTSQAAAYTAGDTYYWTFDATAGVPYTFSNCGAGEDTYLRIYDNSLVMVASNDDFGIHCAETAASLDFTPVTSGTYYVSLAHYSCSPLSNAGNLYYYYTTAATKTLNLTSVLPEGLYAGGGTLNQAKNDVGDPQFPGYADEITVELHNGAAYGTVLHTATVLLSTTGAASVTDIPAALNGNYWITVKHRNSVQTVSATAVSFASDVVNQSFGTPADVYGGNLQLMSDSGYAIFGGDVTQDGVVDTDDMTEVDNDSADYVAGYVPSDVTGDGATDTEDMTIVDNNNANYVGAVTP